MVEILYILVLSCGPLYCIGNGSNIELCFISCYLRRDLIMGEFTSHSFIRHYYRYCFSWEWGRERIKKESSRSRFFDNESGQRKTVTGKFKLDKRLPGRILSFSFLFWRTCSNRRKDFMAGSWSLSVFARFEHILYKIVYWVISAMRMEFYYLNHKPGLNTWISYSPHNFPVDLSPLSVSNRDLGCVLAKLVHREDFV